MDKKFVMSIAAMAALTLVSCSSDDLDSFSDNSSKNEAISFDGYLGRSAVAVNGTRGSEVKIGNLQTDGFGVFGYHNTTEHSSETEQSFNANLFNNQQVTYKNSKWTYSPLKFWPSDGHIDFLAYAPYDKSTTLTDGSKINNFIVDEDIAKQKDLLWTNDMNHQITANITSAKKKVKFQFHHALSRLGYTVKLTGDYSSDDVTFTLKKITLAGSPDETKGAFYKSGTIDLSKANKDAKLWSGQTGQQNFNWFSGDYQVKSSTASHPGSNIEKDKDYLFVIPQNFPEKIQDTSGQQIDNPDKLYVIVEYEVTYKKDTQTSITNKVYKRLTTNFLQGTAYNLNLTVGLPIEFDVNVGIDAGVDGWGTDQDITIGSNENPWER